MTTARPRVGVNLLWLVPGGVGGTEEYAVRLLGALAEQADGSDAPPVTLFAAPSLAEAHPELVAAFPTVTAPLGGAAERGGRPARVAAETSWLPAQARRHRVEVMHHFGGTVPLVAGPPAVVTIHDLQPLAHPEYFGAVKRQWLARMLPWSVRVARRVVAVSEFTRTDIQERLHVSPHKLRVVRHGFDPPTVRPDADAVAAVGRRYGLGPRWFVLPAVTWPHKNHVTLVEAFVAVAAAHPDVTLVLAGGAGPADHAVAARIQVAGLSDRVVRPGRIPRADLDALIAGAVAVPFPSTYEGFGAPALEAMALGTPVLAARAGALPEVVGDAAVLLDPYAVPDWSDAMAHLLTDPDHRARLSASGLARAKQFSWDEPVRELVGVWRDAAAPSTAGGTVAR